MKSMEEWRKSEGLDPELLKLGKIQGLDPCTLTSVTSISGQFSVLLNPPLQVVMHK
jgi:hypothetical protein